jgi:hypothetical protein
MSDENTPNRSTPWMAILLSLGVAALLAAWILPI